MCLTGLTAGVSFINLGDWSGVIALLIASFKALLVAMFFMHLRYENQKMSWVVGLAGVFWLTIMLSLTLSDYVTRNFLPVPGR